MEHFYDEFSKSLAASVPRRESLRRMGAVFAGALLGQLGLSSVWAAKQDPCKSFCRCSNKTQQNQCLAACRACNSNPTRLCGACGTYACTDLLNDFNHCGGCAPCDDPAPYEYGACVEGRCIYWCVEGAGDCGDGTCTYLGADPDNCGTCGYVCPESTPYCNVGTCGAVRCFGGQALCGGVCRELQADPQNCGGCGVVCGPGENCAGGLCQSAESPYWGE